MPPIEMDRCYVREKAKTNSSLQLLEQHVRPAMRAIASHDVDLVYSVAQTPLDDLVGVEPSASGLEECASLMMNRVHQLRSQDHHVRLWIFECFCKTSVAVHNAVDSGHSVETRSTFNWIIVEYKETTISRIMLFSPGQMPPQVTITAPTSSFLYHSFRRAPALRYAVITGEEAKTLQDHPTTTLCSQQIRDDTAVVGLVLVVSTCHRISPQPTILQQFRHLYEHYRSIPSPLIWLTCGGP